tara:strand:- start:145 stop:489 length:345 start_codon:yes stop_codon:yes gene_type:complete
MSSKDQRTVDDNESTYDKWERAKGLFIESLYKPDHELRGCAHNQKCFYELMAIRDEVVEIAREMVNPHKMVNSGIPTLPDTQLPVDSFVESKSYEYAADITMRDIVQFQRGNSL